MELQGQHHRGCGHTPLATTPAQVEEARVTISQARGSHSPGRLLSGSATGAPITSQMTVVMQHRRAGSEPKTDRPSQALKIHPTEQGK